MLVEVKFKTEKQKMHNACVLKVYENTFITEPLMECKNMWIFRFF